VRDYRVVNVLVAYASKHGSTAEIAEAIAQALRADGVRADCVPAGTVRSVGGYDAVVLGSAVYMGRWRGDARRFLRRHRRELRERPLWVFSSGPTGPPEQDDPRWLEPRRTMRRAARIGAREHVVFGGRVPPEGGGPAGRAMARNTPAEYRDRRDWDAIGDWARRISATLTAA
jgi:menaquinone-dependent protoporphyrinogen oxidase